MGESQAAADQQVASPAAASDAYIPCDTPDIVAAGSDDADFDKRLDALKKGKGAQGYTKRRQEKAAQKGSDSKPSAKKGKMILSL